jgi:D-alanine-D-alanine ligase-like ATP-grasp enzyme
MPVRKPKKEKLVLGPLFKKIAPTMGAEVFLEPDWNIAGCIVFKSGQRSYFRYNTIDLNPVGAADISKDKDYANYFMKTLGYPTVPGSKTFYSDAWARAIGAKRRTIDDAYEYAQKIGLPVVVKPNSGSQGAGVSFVHTKKDFYSSMRAIFKRDRVALVQKPVYGKDFRLVILDDELISAYQRVPLNVVGDGRSTIKKLFDAKLRSYERDNRDYSIKLNDVRIQAKLKRLKLSITSVPARDERIFLLDNANLSTGGESIDVTDSMHPQFKSTAIELTKNMGLRFCGVDLMIDGEITEAPVPNKWFVLETNAAPGLDHYVKSGREQEKIVEDLYTKVLRRIEK